MTATPFRIELIDKKNTMVNDCQEDSVDDDYQPMPDPSRYSLNWNERQKARFLENWSKMKGKTPKDLRDLGVKMVIWMFDYIDDMRTLMAGFYTVPNEFLGANEMFLKHCQSIILELEIIIHLVGQPGFEDRIRNLAKMHVEIEPPIYDKYFEMLRDKFYIFVLKTTDETKSSVVSNQWYQFFDCFVTLHKEEYDKMLARKSDKKGCCSLI